MVNVEMLGAPAVGKTTILKELERRWTPEQTWMLDPRFPKGGPWTGHLNEVNILNKFIIENSDLYEQMLDFFLERCTNAVQKARLFYRFGCLHQDLKAISLVSNFGDRYSVALMDECIFTHCSELVESAMNDKRAEELLLDRRLSSGFILVDGSTDIVCQRFMKRGKRINTYKSNDYDYIREKTDFYLDKWRRMANLFKSFSRPCLVLDCTKPATENADRVIDFLETVLPIHALEIPGLSH